MHGWAGDARCWEPWRAATRTHQWEWACAERGYGALAPVLPRWADGAEHRGPRLVIGHSLGPHLLASELWDRADLVVLLASFATFLPPGRPGRRNRAALAGMASSLADTEKARLMLRNFMAKVAEPQSPELLPPGPAEGPLDGTNRMRLREDLDLLAKCEGLPSGFPRGARVLIVEAEEDRIVEPEARAMLRSALPAAQVITLPGVGHALLSADAIARVVEWVESQR